MPKTLASLTGQALPKALASLMGQALPKAFASLTGQALALVLCKQLNAADDRYRPRPLGLTARLALSVALHRRATSPPASRALTASLTVSLRISILNQRFPKSPDGIMIAPLKAQAPVAQLDRVPPSEGGGRAFKSRRVRHN